jgi:hypothetical protein
MGIGYSDIERLIRLRELDLIKPGDAVVEIGAQQLTADLLRSADRVRHLGKLLGVEDMPPLPAAIDDFAKAPLARDLYRWLGFDYAAVDINDAPGNIPLDLNFDRAPRRLRRRFQLVTNFGTTEHIVNQLNAFNVIHDLTAVGGIMLHALPGDGQLDHGMFNYKFKFFWMLARSNDYEFIDADFSTDDDAVPADVIEFLRLYSEPSAERARTCPVTEACIRVALRKRHDIAFVPPLENVPTGVRAHIKKLRSRYWTVFDPDAFGKLRR